jgi:hypothetical protein
VGYQHRGEPQIWTEVLIIVGAARADSGRRRAGTFLFFN